jgi:hypothetical protein
MRRAALAGFRPPSDSDVVDPNFTRHVLEVADRQVSELKPVVSL